MRRALAVRWTVGAWAACFGALAPSVWTSAQTLGGSRIVVPSTDSAESAWSAPSVERLPAVKAKKSSGASGPATSPSVPALPAAAPWPAGPEASANRAYGGAFEPRSAANSGGTNAPAGSPWRGPSPPSAGATAPWTASLPTSPIASPLGAAPPPAFVPYSPYSAPPSAVVPFPTGTAPFGAGTTGPELAGPVVGPTAASAGLFQPTAFLRWNQQPADGATAPAQPGGTTGGGAQGENGEKKTEIGPKPPDDVQQQALRGTSLLLAPGDLQYELSPLYVAQHQEALGLLPDSSITIERIRSRLLLLPISVRYGWKENMEVFGVVPFGLSMLQADNLVRNLDDESGVLGDISFGFVRQLPDWKLLPNTTLSVTCTAPTGVFADATVSTQQASLGNGVWRLGAMLNFVESVDPFVLFAGLGYDHPFARDFGPVDLQLGDSFNFYAGVGFSVTDDLSISAQLNGALQGETQVGGVHLANTDTEPVSMRLAVMRRLTLKSRVQPWMSWGVTDDAADYSLGVRFVHDR